MGASPSTRYYNKSLQLFVKLYDCDDRFAEPCGHGRRLLIAERIGLAPQWIAPWLPVSFVIRSAFVKPTALSGGEAHQKT
jgi:hypothetical protein